MGPGLRLDLKQTQQLVMTPQLQQAIRLLQLSNLELAQWLGGAVEGNPLLSLDDATDGDRAGADDGGPEEPAAEPVPDGTDGTDDAPELPPMAAENLFDTGPGDGPASTEAGRHGGALGGAGSATAFAGSGRTLEERVAGTSSLSAHLQAQLGQMRAEPRTRLIARMLVEMLDEHGYLRTEPAVVAERLGAPAEQVLAALRLVQACEPTGVGARSLGECLALQLAERDRLDPAMQALLDNLELLARGEQRRLKRLTGMDDEDLAAALAELRALDPRPCAAFATEPPPTVVPDVFVRRADWGGWRVELNAETMPRVLVDQDYAAELERGGASARRFVADCRADAGWLVKSLEQRARTILKVATEIVRRQEGFLERGVAGLQPMTLKMVAEATGIHESTASRVTANKYIATERGTFELKFFFTNALGGDTAEGVAASSVRQRIKTMIDAEPADAVLSDDTIVATLADEGIEIARRTVAKYRKILRIPSSVDRRRQKALIAQSRDSGPVLLPANRL